MTGSDLDNLLDDTSVPDAQPTPDAPAEAAAPEPQGETGEKQSAAPPTDATTRQQPESGYVPVKAVADERRKRQELEKRLAEFEQRFAQLSQPQQPAPEPPSWDLEPAQAAQYLQQQFQHQVWTTRVALAEEMLREKHADYDEVSATFAEAAKQDPSLLNRLYAAPNPARFAYQEGRKLRMLAEIGDDPEAYEKRILAKYGFTPGQQQQSAPPREAPRVPAQSVPRSLARDVSQQPRNSRGQFDGPASLDDLLG